MQALDRRESEDQAETTAHAVGEHLVTTMPMLHDHPSRKSAFTSQTWPAQDSSSLWAYNCFLLALRDTLSFLTFLIAVFPLIPFPVCTTLLIDQEGEEHQRS